MKSCICFSGNKSIFKTFLTSNQWIRREICTDQGKHCLQEKTAQNQSKHMWVDFDVREEQGRLFHWRKHYYGLWTNIFAISNGLKLKCLDDSSWWICFSQTLSFLLHTTYIDELDCCGLLVDYCDVFISCLDSHSDGTHSLQRIH